MPREDNNIRVGHLRWPVTITQRVQTASGTNTLTESETKPRTVWADVQPIGPMTYYMGQQTDRPITHVITIRWQDWLDQTYIITRASARTGSDDSSRTEIFRIRRIMEIGGRKRFLKIECELETRENL